MAVTQNLARVTPPLLDSCRESTKVLDNVCSFEALPADDYLDADWAPSLLLATAEAEPLSAFDRELLRRAFDGDAEVNPAYRELPDTIWEHPVTATGPDGVRHIAAALSRLVESSFPSADAVVAALAPLATNMRPSRPRDYLRQHLTAVATFYEGASQRGNAVLAWWD